MIDKTKNNLSKRKSSNNDDGDERVLEREPFDFNMSFEERLKKLEYEWRTREKKAPKKNHSIELER